MMLSQIEDGYPYQFALSAPHHHSFLRLGRVVRFRRFANRDADRIIQKRRGEMTDQNSALAQSGGDAREIDAGKPGEHEIRR